MVSIIIPSRNEKFLNQTIVDLLAKAKGKVEVIVVLDGYWEKPIEDDRVIYIHRGKSYGMRPAINAAVDIAQGEFLLKSDAHCLWDDGYDIKLAEHCEENWIVIPRRKRLDADNWCIQDVGKPDVDYEFLSYPEDPKDFGGPSLTGKIWTERILERADIMIDDLPASQGSAWFMRKSYYRQLGLMDEETFGPFWNESQELALKSILSGGRYVVNKNTWYAHLHKGKVHGRGYTLNHEWLYKGRNAVMKFFQGEKCFEGQKYPLSYLIEKFMPMPTWTDEKLAELKAREEVIWK